MIDTINAAKSSAIIYSIAKKGEVVVLDASESILYKNVMCDGWLGGTIADERWIVKDERQVVID